MTRSKRFSFLTPIHESSLKPFPPHPHQSCGWPFQGGTVKPQWLEHWWLVYFGLFELVFFFFFFFESLGNSSDSSGKQIFRAILRKISWFVTKIYVVCAHKNRLNRRFWWVYSTYHIFYRRSKIHPEVILICLLTWRYDYPSLARTTHV